MQRSIHLVPHVFIDCGDVSSLFLSVFTRSRSSEIGRFERFFNQLRPIHIGAPGGAPVDWQLRFTCDLYWDVDLSIDGALLVRNIDKVLLGRKWLKKVWRFFVEFSLEADAIDRDDEGETSANSRKAALVYSSRLHIQSHFDTGGIFSSLSLFLFLLTYARISIVLCIFFLFFFFIDTRSVFLFSPESFDRVRKRDVCPLGTELTDVTERSEDAFTIDGENGNDIEKKSLLIYCEDIFLFSSVLLT